MSTNWHIVGGWGKLREPTARPGQLSAGVKRKEVMFGTDHAPMSRVEAQKSGVLCSIQGSTITSMGDLGKLLHLSLCLVFPFLSLLLTSAGTCFTSEVSEGGWELVYYNLHPFTLMSLEKGCLAHPNLGYSKGIRWLLHRLVFSTEECHLEGKRPPVNLLHPAAMW